MIDLTKSPVEIGEEDNVPGGVALVISKDGTSVEVKYTDRFESLDAMITSGLGSLAPTPAAAAPATPTPPG